MKKASNYPRIICLLILFAANFSFIGGQTLEESQILLPNQNLEREVTGKTTHRYKIDLKKDEFFQVRVEQKGVDVQLKLTDEKGNILATMDSPNGNVGFETLTFVANENKSFQLEVICPDEKTEKGKYIIFRAASRISTPQDKRRVDVERLFVEGIKARDTEGQAEIGIAKLAEALKGWQELKDEYLADLTSKNLTALKENKHFATFYKLYQNLGAINNLSEEGHKLTYKSKADTLKGRAKLLEALAGYRNLKAQVYDKTFIEKIKAASRESKAPITMLLNLQRFSRVFETQCLNSIAQTHYNFGEWKEYIEYNKQVFSNYQEIISDKELAPVVSPENLFTMKFLSITNLRQIGSSLDGNLGKTEEGLAYFEKALDYCRNLFEETKDERTKRLEAGILRTIAAVYGRNSQNITKTIEYFTKASEIYRTLSDSKTNEADISTMIALQYMGSFQYRSAIENFEESLRVYRETDNKLGQVNILQMLGIIYSILNNKNESGKYLNQGLQILQSSDFAENFHKNFAKETQGYEGFEVYKEANADFVEYSRLSSIGAAYKYLEDYPKASEYFLKTLEVARIRKESRDIRSSLVDVAYSFGKLKKWDEATKYYLQALEISLTTENREDIAKDLQNIGWTLLEAGKFEEALKYQNEAIYSYKLVGIDENNAFTPSYSTLLNEISRTYNALKNNRLAIFYAKRAVNAMQGERQRLQNLDSILQKGFLEKKEEHYRRLADWLFEAGRFAEAEEVLRMLKEEEFSKFVRRDPEEINKLGQRIGLNAREKKAFEEYSKLTDNLAKIGVEYEKIKSEKGVICEQNPRCQELDDQLKTANTVFKSFLTELETEFKKIPKRDVRDEIDTERSRQVDLQKWNAVSIYTLVGEERLRVFLTTPRVQTDRKKEIKPEELNAKIADFRKALTDPNVDPRPLGKELYDILIAPIEKQIKDSGAKTLLFSLDGTLRYIPIAALWDGEKYLVEKYQIVLLTSKTKGKLTDENKTDWKIFGGGVTEKSDVTEPERKSFGGLPSVKKELDSIIREENSTGFFNGKKYINETFTQESLENNLSGADFNVLHLATHFRLGRDDKTSFLLLGNNKTLTLDEISNSNIQFGSIDLVVLSACETAFGNNGSEGGEVDSSATFFELKGAKSIMASLWSVADNSTSELMIAFYEIRRENPLLSKAGALRLAQIKLLNGRYKTDEIPKWRGTQLVGAKTQSQPSFKTDENAPFAHPYYWSPFVLIGNWR